MLPKMKTKITACFIVVVLSFSVLASCQGESSPTGGNGTGNASTENGGETNEPGPDSITLRVAWWGNQLRNETTAAMLEAYEDENSHVKFETEFSDWSGYWDRLATQAVASNLADIIQQDLQYITQYYEANQLVNLSEQIEAGNLNVDDVADSILASGTFDDALYALCSGVNAVGMIYNTRLAEEAGVDVPMRITYNDVMEFSTQIFEETGVRAEVATGQGGMIMMARSLGDQLYDHENNRIGASEETILEIFTIVKDTIESDWSLSVDVLQELSTAGLENHALPTGQAWNNFPGGSNMLAAYQAVMEDELAMVMYPTIDNPPHENMYLRPAMFWSITTTSEHVEESAKVINYYTNSETAQDLLMAERGVPVSEKMAEYLMPQLDEVQQRIFAYIAEVTEIAVPVDPPPPAGANEVDSYIGDLIDLVRYGEISPEEATERFFTEANSILANAAE